MYLCDTLDDFSFVKTSIIENGLISWMLHNENLSIIDPKLKYWTSSMRPTEPMTSDLELLSKSRSV